MGERSEGATVELTTRGACPKARESASSGAFHHRAACTGPGGLAVQQHHRDRLSLLVISRGTMFSVCLTLCVYRSTFLCVCYVRLCSCISIYMHPFLSSCVWMSSREHGRLVVYAVPAKLPGWITEGVDILLSIMCTNNMVTYSKCIIITPKKVAGSA